MNELEFRLLRAVIRKRMDFNENHAASGPEGGQFVSSSEGGGTATIERPGEKLRRSNQTKTVEFKTWFKGSKVVDKNGQPLVVYRGDRPDKTTFTGKEDPSVIIKGNVFFSSEEDIAKFYTKYRTNYRINAADLSEKDGLYRVYISMKNPLVVKAGKGDSWDGIPTPDEVKGKYKSDKIQIDDLAQVTRKMGYDGLIVKNVWDQAGLGTQYVVFKPEQIKSAIGNRGTFNPKSGNILDSLQSQIRAKLDFNEFHVASGPGGGQFAAAGEGVAGAGGWSGSQVTVQSGKVPERGGRVRYNKNGDPDSKGDFVRNVVHYASPQLLKEAEERGVGGHPELSDTDKFQGVEQVKLSELSTNQALVRLSSLERHIDASPSSVPLIVAKLPSGTLLIDGNHRASTALQRGEQEFPAQVFDFTKEAERFPETKEPTKTERGMVLDFHHYMDPEIVNAVEAYKSMVTSSKDKVETVAPPAEKLAETRNKLEPVYRKAREAQGEFKEGVRKIQGEDYDKHGTDKLKSMDRAAVKVASDYDGDVTKLGDILRTTIIMPDESHKAEILKRIGEQFEIVKVKDRFAQPTPDGYKALMTNVRLKNGSLAEIQASTPEMLVKKDLAHHLYAITRVLPEGHPLQVRGSEIQRDVFSRSLRNSPSFMKSPSAPARSLENSRRDASEETVLADPSGNKMTGALSTSRNLQPEGRDLRSKFMPTSLFLVHERIKQKLDAGNPNHKGSGEGGGQFTASAENGVDRGGGTNNNLQGKQSGGKVDETRMSLELAPHPADVHANEQWAQLDTHERFALTQKVLDDQVPRLMEAYGIDGVKPEYHLGGYGDTTSPSASIKLPPGTSGEALVGVAQTLGYALKQESVFMTSTKEIPGGLKKDAVVIELPKEFGQAEVEKLYTALRKGNEELVGGHLTAEGHMMLANTSDTVLDEQFVGGIKKALDSQYPELNYQRVGMWSALINTDKEPGNAGSNQSENSRRLAGTVRSSRAQVENAIASTAKLRGWKGQGDGKEGKVAQLTT